MNNNPTGRAQAAESVPAKRARRGSGGITLRELAQMVGVTKVTISRALNTPERVSPETLQKIQEAVRQTGYVPNLVAGSLASNRSRLVMALVPSLAGSVFQETTEAMTTALADAGYQLLIGQGGYDKAREDALIDAVIGRRPAGIVLTGVMHSPISRERLRGAGVPVVETWDLTDTPVDMLVGFSHAAVGQEAARHLHARGARHAAVITPGDARALVRSAAFCKAMQALCGRPVPVYPMPSPTHLGNGREALALLLREHPETDAVFCGADSLALGALIEARARGLAVPGQLKVLGYGDQNFARHTDPPLSTMRIDGTQIGKLAARMLVDRIEGRTVTQTSVDVGFELVQRDST
ncbi:LacI family DNA-binding transcriptional regulator [Noviherbaspirillum soli]|uniref:LacI family DNA-binding transcriptional regulator n=1 Tax=Noviherbaspirillum soli TaxID=1064518 RepID=UPI001E56C1F6|nr:LacI family DNA-binding transcriptional regulator [Noviherbaspirillum soli]